LKEHLKLSQKIGGQFLTRLNDVSENPLPLFRSLFGYSEKQLKLALNLPEITRVQCWDYVL
jgi:hypothetical protein